MQHDSDCALHNAPALPPGPCDCGAVRRARIARLRTRLKQITPNDGDMIDLIGVVKGLIDVLADDGEDK